MGAFYFNIVIESIAGHYTASLGSCVPYTPCRVAIFESHKIINNAVTPWYIALQATLAEQRGIVGSYSLHSYHVKLPQSCCQLYLPYS